MAVLNSPKREKFAQNIAQGMSQRAAYRDAFPNSAKWKDNTVDAKACALNATPDVSARVTELKEAAASAAVLTRMERMVMLTNVAINEEEPTKIRLQAVDILNKMDGDYTKKIEIAGDTSGISAKVSAILAEK